MAALRSTRGCWTCRLRRKKCDEIRPTCATCESLAITCHGYGPKPEWMDGGEQEKEMANSIKQIVKHTSRRKGRPSIFGRRSKDTDKGHEAGAPTSNLAPKSSHTSPESSTDSHPTTTDCRSPAPSSVTSADSAAIHSSSGSLTITSDESTLLMHFLDNVFPLQYPMYSPSIAEGGRGWLLSLLLTTKPLLHAALALSSYHRGTMVLEESRNQCRSVSLQSQERHLAICLAEFQEQIRTVGQFVAGNCSKNGIGMMASTVELIFFELFAGNGDAWQIHLRAATDMFTTAFQGQPELLDEFKFLEIDLHSPEYKGPPDQKVVIFRFLSGVVLWLDIISSVTNGKAPRLLPVYNSPVLARTKTNLQQIMGCPNWAIFQIGQITALHEDKMHELYTHGFTTTEFTARADAISRDLARGVENNRQEVNIKMDKDAISSQRLITLIFALSAFIYLHLVVHGFNAEQEGLSNRISEVMILLHTESGRSYRHVLVCPLYIVGCAARNENEKELFRRVFSTPPVLYPSLEHRAKILPLLEETWRRKSCDQSWTWADNLRLSNHPLLLF